MVWIYIWLLINYQYITEYYFQSHLLSLDIRTELNSAYKLHYAPNILCCSSFFSPSCWLCCRNLLIHKFLQCHSCLFGCLWLNIQLKYWIYSNGLGVNLVHTTTQLFYSGMGQTGHPKCAIYVHNDLPICHYLVFAQVELDPEKQLK